MCMCELEERAVGHVVRRARTYGSWRRLLAIATYAHGHGRALAWVVKLLIMTTAAALHLPSMHICVNGMAWRGFMNVNRDAD